jgi:hypothetical protein
MKSTELTMNVANIALMLYVVYAIFFIPFNATLISIATGLIVYGSLNSYEAAVALTLISGVLFALLVKPKPMSSKEGFSGGSPTEISARIQTMTKGGRAEPTGIHSSSFIEGFADLSGNAPTNTASLESATPSPPVAAAPVPTATPSTAAAAAAAAPSTAQKDDKPPAAAAGFRSGGTESDSLFKLGVIPDEGKGGFHIDQGTTVINALNALKPDQVKQMTDDTQKLIDTQKSLMSLLSSVKPMMQDGKQMLDTFQQMFGTSMPQGNPLA